MFDDLDKTIERILKEEMPIENGKIDIRFDQPTRDWSTKLAKPTINLFLYDVRENPTLRKHQWEEAGNGQPGDHLHHRKRSSFRLDCYYMLTTWGADSKDEHRLLARCMRTLFRFPVLEKKHLEGSLESLDYEIQARLANHDRLTNPAEIWSALENNMRPSIPYIVTLALDPWTAVKDPIVQTLILRPGPAEGLPEEPHLVSYDPQQDSAFIGGTVRNKKTGKPLEKISVAIKGTGLFATTDEQGRFRLGPLAYNTYTLVAWPAEGKPQEKEITIYDTRQEKKRGDYDVEL